MIIPVIHCFDNNYVIPAAVAFLSMLEHANPAHTYQLHVLHTNISEENQAKLQSVVGQFKNASLAFVNMDNKFDDLFSQTVTKGHYSKEMYYKLCISTLFPQYDFAIVTDVDVVYQGDISTEYEKFIQTTEYYIAGVYIDRLKGTFLETHNHIYDCDFNKEEKNILSTGIGAGYLIFNLKKIRADEKEKELITYARANANRLRQPEQDVLNLCLYDHIYRLPLSSMICTYLYDIQEQTPDAITDIFATAMQKPIQIHYATIIKPWNTPSCAKAHIWYTYLLKTPFFYEQMCLLSQKIETSRKAKYTLLSIPIIKIKDSKAKLLGFIPLKKENKK